MYSFRPSTPALRPILGGFPTQPRPAAQIRDWSSHSPIRPASFPSSSSRLFHSSPSPRANARSGSSGGERSRAGRYLRNAALPVLSGLVVAWYDDQFLSNSISRTCRTFYFGVSTALDFKLFWDGEDESVQEAIHRRTARKLKWLIETNGGLYIKLGQTLAIQAAILPKPYREALDGIFDRAPAHPWEVADEVVRKELGSGMEDLFESVDRQTIASASIAQVYRARLRHPRAAEGEEWQEGEGWVAVKVRKPEIPQQVEWDLFAYRSLLWAFEKGFEIPIAFLGPNVTQEMRKEANLLNEAENAAKTQSLLLQERSLRDKVLVPKVQWKYTGDSVMTAEFVEGCKLTDVQRIEEMGLSIKEVMDECMDLYGFLTFDAGWLHCDPHPGNILVRQNPRQRSQPQLILIDHGLYIALSPKFKQQYCTLFTSALSADLHSIQEIAIDWGIPRENADLFASLALLRPGRNIKRRNNDPTARSETETTDSDDERRRKGRGMVKEKLQEMLANQAQIPRELIFLTRTLRMIQGNNAAVGSPSNRLGIMARWARKGSKHAMRHHLTEVGLRSYVTYQTRQLVFAFSLALLDATHYVWRAAAYVVSWFKPSSAIAKGGLETTLQKEVSELAKREFGVEIDQSVFEG